MPRRIIPFDYATTLDMDDWRDRVAWPIGYAEANDLVNAQVIASLGTLARIDDPLVRDAAMLAMMNILGYARVIVLAARCLERSGEHDILVGKAPELAFLEGDWPAAEPPPKRAAMIMPTASVRLALARRAARIAAWTPLWRVPIRLISTPVCAVSHNHLLCGYAAQAGIPVSYQHGTTLMARARQRAPDGPVDSGSWAGPIARDLVACANLGDRYRERAEQLVSTLVQPHLERAMRDIAGLRAIKRLPNEIWSGSGGAYDARAIGIEVLRRGGQATRFEHGCPAGFIECAEMMAVGEFAVSTRIVSATPTTRDALDATKAPALAKPLSEISIEAHTGDPTFRRIPIRRRGTAGRRPRVVYAPNFLLGFRQIAPALLPDTIYFDWQLRVAEAVAGLPVELLCKPHPEGLLQGKSHPLEAYAPVSYQPFEAIIDEADIFLFDYPASTTFWEAVCTDRPVVVLDLGLTRMTSAISGEIERRCRIIPVEFNDANRPDLDPEPLADALLNPAEPIDPTPLRDVLGGTEGSVPMNAAA